MASLQGLENRQRPNIKAVLPKSFHDKGWVSLRTRTWWHSSLGSWGGGAWHREGTSYFLGPKLHKQIKVTIGFLGNYLNRPTLKSSKWSLDDAKDEKQRGWGVGKRGHDVDKISSCYSQSLWSIVTVNTGLVNIGGNTGLGAGHNIFINWRNLIFMYFPLKVSYLIYSWFINIEPTSNSSCLNEACLTYVIFL